MAERTNVAIQQRVHEDPPDRSAGAIRQDIAAKRESISEAVDKLGDRIHRTFDWHEYVAEYPAVALGLAAGVGFVIAGMFKRNPTPQERILDAVADLTEDMTDRIGDVMSGVIQKKLVSGRTLKAAATAMIARAAVDLLKKQISGAIAGDNSQLRGRPAAQSRVRSNPDTSVQPSRSSTSGY
ncbi:MAG TPA: hypothetical protein VNO24_15575 [Blastocatellia bacterium]|nr:hypothetical protein [Blastocatellia bacterium]